MLWKKDKRNMNRSFGGINVLFVGDFLQLDPTAGIPLNRIPTAWIKKGRKFAPGASDEHGQALFWGQTDGCVQGVTILEECKRHEEEDAWLLQMQNEFRLGKLSADTHAFLHGRKTSVPGSMVNGKLMCGNKECEKRRMTSPEITT